MLGADLRLIIASGVFNGRFDGTLCPRSLRQATGLKSLLAAGRHLLNRRACLFQRQPYLLKCSETQAGVFV